MMIEPEARITYNGLLFNNELARETHEVAPAQVLRRNVVTNPSFLAGVAGWSNFAGVPALTWIADAGDGKPALIATGTSATSGVVQSSAEAWGVTAGQVITVRAKIHPSGSSPNGVVVRLNASSLVVADLSAWTHGSGWGEITTTITVPAGTTVGTPCRLQVGLKYSSAQPPALALRDVMVTVGPGPYFDGDTPAVDGKEYRWSGAVGASASEEYLPAVVKTTDIPGPVWHVASVDGIGDPAAVYAREKRVQAAGDWMGRAYKGSAAMGMSGYTECTSSAEADRMITLLRRAVSLEDAPLTLHWASGPRTRMVRRDGEIVITRPTPTMFEWSFTVVASDPAWYEGSGDDGVNTYSTRLPSSTGGLAFPVTFPITFTGTSSTGDIGIENTGDGGRWQFRIDGPVVNPRIIVANDAGVRTLAWSLTILGGEYIEIDPQRQETLLQGQASRPPYLRQWPTFLPGLNVVRFRADSGGGGAKLTVATRAAL